MNEKYIARWELIETKAGDWLASVPNMPDGDDSGWIRLFTDQDEAINEMIYCAVEEDREDELLALAEKKYEELPWNTESHGWRSLADRLLVRAAQAAE